MFLSIRWKLTASYAVLALLTAATLGLLSLILIENAVARQEREYLRSTAESIALQIEPYLGADADVSEIQPLIDAMSFLSDVRINILNSGKEPLLESTERVRISLSTQSLPGMDIGAPERGEPPFGRSTLIPDRGWGAAGEIRHPILQLIRRGHGLIGRQFVLEGVDAAAPEIPRRTLTPQPKTIVPVGRDRAPVGYVQLIQEIDFGEKTVNTARRAIGLAAAGAVLIAVLAGLVMSRKLTAPIVLLTSTVQSMSKDDMSLRVPETRKDEIGRLARQFNRMAARLQASFRQLTRERDTLKRFIEDASHELRTPVTALKTFNELLLDRAGKDAVMGERFLLESQSQLARLEAIITDLLDLSRLEGGVTSLSLATHPAEEILASAVQAVSVKADSSGVRLSVRPPESASIRRPESEPDSIRPAKPGTPMVCDRPRIERVLVNLLDNAIKYSDRNGVVEAACEQGGDWIDFRIEDEGKGIQDVDLPHVFERFYRSKTSLGEGSGLGLAIVRSVAQSHGGRVTVESRVGGGSRFTFRLPRSGPPPGEIITAPAGEG